MISTLRPENTNRNVNKCSVTRGFDFVFGFLGVSGIVNIVKHELVCNIHTILLSITIIDLFFFFFRYISYYSRNIKIMFHDTRFDSSY